MVEDAKEVLRLAYVYIQDTVVLLKGAIVELETAEEEEARIKSES